jgi:hypothetical protein
MTALRTANPEGNVTVKICNKLNFDVEVKIQIWRGLLLYLFHGNETDLLITVLLPMYFP